MNIPSFLLVEALDKPVGFPRTTAKGRNPETHVISLTFLVRATSVCIENKSGNNNALSFPLRQSHIDHCYHERDSTMTLNTSHFCLTDSSKCALCGRRCWFSQPISAEIAICREPGCNDLRGRVDSLVRKLTSLWQEWASLS